MHSMVNEPLVEIENLTKSFKEKQVFNNFFQSIIKNKITTIFGPSGSGKSTLLNIIGLLESYDSGNIKLFGHDLPKVNSRQATMLRRNKISYLFQNFGLIEGATVRENLEIGLQYQKLNRAAKKAKMKWALEQVDLTNQLTDHVYNLSGGEQQRLALARVLLKPAELILADEPTGSLDYDNRNYVMEKFLEMKNNGKTIVIVSHDPAFKDISDRVINL